ncbi:GPN-loop GTPase 2 [Vigna unguiculata]|uniref:GPN-loop GTPase 2 n=1 Tax=Vigna unguiculata TaxID=3917 RepID=A0A4D6NWY5_VIGUN|nr:GPN-loop GTPase 2 [Vigna unguiculata]
MILALGARGPEFDSRNAPSLFQSFSIASRNQTVSCSARLCPQPSLHTHYNAGVVVVSHHSTRVAIADACITVDRVRVTISYSCITTTGVAFIITGAAFIVVGLASIVVSAVQNLECYAKEIAFGHNEGRKMVFGQVVVGPPGSGKTTYCNGMSQFLSLIGRKVAVINLDPANDSLPYDCAVNIEDLVKLSDVMVEHSLGPNGGLVYCMDYLEKNIDWLEAKLEPLLKDHYLLFDFPGQVELFFLHSNAKNVIMKLIKKLNLRLTAVHLIDAHLCSDPGKYISALLLSLSTMLHLELPHVNVLSKIDLIESYGKLAFNLDFYTDVQDLSYLQYQLDQDPRSAKYRKLTKELCEVIENFSLVSFTTLDIQDKESVGNLVKVIDKCNGYIFTGIEASAVEFSKIAVGPVDWDYYRYPFFLAAVQEKYMKDDENIDDNE